MQARRQIRTYLLIMAVIMAFGLPARTIQDRLPSWYVQYFGDYLWAMLLFFGFSLVLQNTGTFNVALVTLLFSYGIEVSQLFHPQWLDHLRNIKLLALVFGFTFLWSDIAAYTLGVSTGVLIEYLLLRKVSRPHPEFLGNDKQKV